MAKFVNKTVKETISKDIRRMIDRFNGKNLSNNTNLFFIIFFDIWKMIIILIK